MVCTFERKLTGRKKVITFFVTTSLISSLSLISFFVPRENVPGRLGVLVTLYLLLINVYRNLSVPPKIGFGYIDLWFILIQGPVLMAVLEYGFILVCDKYCRTVVKLRAFTIRAFSYIDLATFAIVLAYLLIVISAGAKKMFDPLENPQNLDKTNKMFDPNKLFDNNA